MSKMGRPDLDAKELRKIKKALDLGNNYGAGPTTIGKQLKGVSFDETIIDDLQKIFAIYGIDLMTKIKIASLENTKMKEILYDESNKTNK